MTQWSTDNIHVFDGTGCKVAKLEQDSEHGDLIVTAVNSHDGLLEALERAEKHFRILPADRDMPGSVLYQMAAAIKAAQ